MNNTLCMTTDAELNNISNCTTCFDLFEGVEDNATAPMASVLPPSQQWSEEELHTSFEQALIGRVTEVHGRLSRISSVRIPTQRAMCNTDPIVAFLTFTGAKKHRLPRNGMWQRYVIFVSFVFMCIMMGFDLMGLLVLHMMR